jgi:hypothetical protein
MEAIPDAIERDDHGLRDFDARRVRSMIWLWVAIAVALDGVVALASGLVPDRWLVRYRAPMLGFATGTLLASGLGSSCPAVARRDSARS